MLTRIRPRLVIDLARRDVPAPVDVINLITPADFAKYRWYGLLVLPVLIGVGGKPLWMGRFERSIAGEQQTEKLLVIRYPSHRRFLAMTLNPYYLAINKLREAGVKRFEASFTHASHCHPDLARRRDLVGVHFNSTAEQDAGDAIRELFEAAGYELAYATRLSATLGILDPPRETDPKPLRFAELALFAPPSDGPDAADLESLAGQTAALVQEFSLQHYKREPRSTYRPSLRAVPQAA